MLTIYRSNRAEWLAKLLAEQLKLEPPSPFEEIDIVVNTWPTSRWLKEELAIVNKISALIRFPFPGSYLKQIVQNILDEKVESDPWDTDQLVWTLLDLLPEFLTLKEAEPLKNWIYRHTPDLSHLNKETWRIARCIADTFDDYALYRPEYLNHWIKSDNQSSIFIPSLPPLMQWQPLLFRELSKRINTKPFCLQVHTAIERLRKGDKPNEPLPKTLRIFGLSSLAPVQIELLQAISGLTNVQIFLLTPCPELWQRCKSRREQLGNEWLSPPDGEWFLKLPKLEASLGRMGAEFQQLLEGSGESQLGELREGNLFAAPAKMAELLGTKPSLLEQIQQNIANPLTEIPLKRKQGDFSLQFFSCPGQLRQVQLIRDQILQWFAADESLQPRDVLIMTPNVDRFASLLNSVFNDSSSTGVKIPWRITDRSQHSTPGLNQGLLHLLDIAGDRLTASSLETLLSNPAIQKQQNINQDDTEHINHYLQLAGFRWGLDASERGGDETHSLSWCLDRWLLGLVLPKLPGPAPGGAAPFNEGLEPAKMVNWWQLLTTISNMIRELRRPRLCNEWIDFLKNLIEDLFGNGGDWSWEKQCCLNALENWRRVAGHSQQIIEIGVIQDLLTKEISINKGRFGHRCGSLTISALEPMRSIPHRVIILMGLDDGVFPRNQERPSFHLMEGKRRLGDPSSNDQDRYVLLESLMSSRQHLLITWNGRDEKTGEARPASQPIQQWITQIKHQLGDENLQEILQAPDPNPLGRSNFLRSNDKPPFSCDIKSLNARRWLDKNLKPKDLALALPISWTAPSYDIPIEIASESLQQWMIAPQLTWLEGLKIKPREWNNTIQDLEDLELSELKRYHLLKEHIDNFLISIPIDDTREISFKPSINWDILHSGKGLFPPGLASNLESERLNNRCKSLHQLLNELGSLRRENLQVSDNFKSILFAGKSLVVIQPGLLKANGVMEGWLNHLQACANNLKLDSTIILSRTQSKKNKDGFEKSLLLKRIPCEEARKHLKTLEEVAYQGKSECWPIPPQSGWELAKASSKGIDKAIKVFSKVWEGGFNQKGERELPEMQICFGERCGASKLLNLDCFEDAYNILYGPIIDCIS